MEFSRQDYGRGLPFPIPGDLPNPRSNPHLLYLLHWQVDSLPLCYLIYKLKYSDFRTWRDRQSPGYLGNSGTYLRIPPKRKFLRRVICVCVYSCFLPWRKELSVTWIDIIRFWRPLWLPGWEIIKRTKPKAKGPFASGFCRTQLEMLVI